MLVSRNSFRVFVLLSLCLVAFASTASERPNILLVVADDMGWTDLGSYGSEIDTPNLDALADRGIRFSNFYASLSCSPTRSMLLTGTDNHIAGIGNMGELLTENQRGNPGYEGYLNDRVVSLAETLKENGYHTYMAGKWHLGHQPEQVPHKRGFERTYSMLDGAASHWPDKFGVLPPHPVANYTRNGEFLDELPGDFYSSRSYADFLIDSIRENRADGKPFLAYLAFSSPHDPMQVPEPWLSKYRGRYDAGYDALKAQRTAAARELGLVRADAPDPQPVDMLPTWDSLDEERQAIEARGMEVYAGMVDNLDYHYGRVVNFLKDIGEYENTLIIFMADNGSNPWFSEDYPGMRGSDFYATFDNSLDNIGHPGSHYAYGLGFGSASAGPLDRFKLTTGDGGIRVPLIISGPGVEGEGRLIDALGYVWDLKPTILESLDIEPLETYQGREVEPMRGRPLNGLMDGSADRVYSDTDYIAGELTENKWIRQGDYKAVFIPEPYGDASWKLFNLDLDPGETNDLGAAEPDKLKEMVAAWERYADDVGYVPVR